MHRRLATAVVFAALLPGCDLLSRATNHTDLVGTLVVSPQPPGSAAPQAVVATVFLGQHQGELSGAPTFSGLGGATVTVTWDGLAQPIALPETTAGNYTATWTTSTHAYVPGATYTFTATLGSDTYWVKAVGAAVPTMSLAGATTGVSFGGVQAVTYGGWSSTPAPVPLNRSGTDVGLVAVFPISGATVPSALPPPTCTNAPKDGSGFFDLAFSDGDWTKSTFNLPKQALGEPNASPRFDAPCLPSAEAAWVVGLTALKKGSDSSSNLSIVSTALVGTSAAAVVIGGP